MTGYRRATDADRTNDEIQFYLGHCLENGLGAVRDLARARAWYEKSAAQGNAKARAALARLDGKGSGKDEEAERKAREEEERRKAEAERVYIVDGKATMDSAWGPPNVNSRFFRVRVSMPNAIPTDL